MTEERVPGEKVPRLDALFDTVSLAIDRYRDEWDVAPAEVIGVLESIKLKYWHMMVIADEEG